MPKINDVPFKLSIAVYYSDDTFDECTDRYDLIRVRFHTLVNYLIDHYDCFISSVCLLDNAKRCICKFENCM